MAFSDNAYMATLVPGNSSLESIGSVAANFARSSEEEQRLEYITFYSNSVLAEMIADDIADMQARSEAVREYEAKRLARKAAREAVVKRFHEQLRRLW